jgi:hypothetical protein
MTRTESEGWLRYKAREQAMRNSSPQQAVSVIDFSQ